MAQKSEERNFENTFSDYSGEKNWAGPDRKVLYKTFVSEKFFYYIFCKNEEGYFHDKLAMVSCSIRGLG